MNTLTVALIGNPNTGKSSLFNGLCGMRARVGNFPGVTVEKKVGTFVHGERSITVVDLPGTYSLSARSLDELVSVDALMGETSDVPPIDAVVVVVDGNHLERDLYLFSQLAELNKPMILVLNMWDRVLQSRLKIDLEKLQSRLNVPIVTTTASKLVGIDRVKSELSSLKVVPPVRSNEGLFPQTFDEESRHLTQAIEGHGHIIRSYLAERLLLDAGGALEKRWTAKPRLSQLSEHLGAARQRLKSSGCEIPFVESRVRHAWVRETLQDVADEAAPFKPTISDHIDKVTAHRWWGPGLFAVVMFLIFQLLFSNALTGVAKFFQPEIEDFSINGWIEAGLGAMSEFVESMLPPGALRSLVNDGIIGGVGGVLTFVPQIAFLFLLIAIMEDCGYMARVALVMDRWMSRLGLNGKAFLPLVTSFGCAVPGIMATRTIENTRDRLVTILIAPLMSCSARFPVYYLLILAFVPAKHYLGGWVTLQGLTFLAMYSIGIVTAIPVAWLLKRFLLPGKPSPFVMELPRYSFPSWRVVLHRVSEQVWSFISRAGTLILATSILLWAAAYFPEDHTREIELAKLLDEQNAELEAEGSGASPEATAALAARLGTVRAELNLVRAELIERSWLGRCGRSLEPVFHAVGWDWKIGVGVIASFPAREVIIATLGTIYSLGSEIDETDEGLQARLRAARWPDGRPVFNVVTALSIMVFFALCAQCAATLMTIRQETQTWVWPIFTFVYMTGLAYFAAWLVYRVGFAVLPIELQ